ncbi:hypothetical protein GCM10010350_49280 [Streptomyces galilaeus]|nr:hypothetical protein GCM10010350_49280 [Streptomyces galilaeus]
MPGCAFSNSAPRAVKLSWREAAAKTVTVPDTFAAPGAEELDPDEVSSEEEQALSTSSVATAVPVRGRVRRAVRGVTVHSSVSRRRRGPSDGPCRDDTAAGAR